MQVSLFDTIGDNRKDSAGCSTHRGQDRLPRTITFIDLFAGIGGMRKGFEAACTSKGYSSKCVFTSEIKPHAIKVLQQNNPDEKIYGDITQVSASSMVTLREP